MSNKTITAYAFAKIANSELKAYGVEKTLPPQMFYTYFKKNFITDQTEDGAIAWVYKYVSKNFAEALSV